MGVPESSGSRNSLMMKSLFIVGAFLAAYAVAEAEPEATPNAEANADPWYAYSGYGLGHYGYRPYYRSYYRPYGYGYWEEKRGKQKLNPQLLLKLMLILTIMPMVMVLDAMDTTAPPMDMDIEDIGEKRKGKPKLSPPLCLIPMLTPGTGIMDMDIGVERRGKLKLSLRL